jgi:hypothetical protein
MAPELPALTRITASQEISDRHPIFGAMDSDPLHQLGVFFRREFAFANDGLLVKLQKSKCQRYSHKSLDFELFEAPGHFAELG